MREKERERDSSAYQNKNKTSQKLSMRQKSIKRKVFSIQSSYVGAISTENISIRRMKI